MLRDTRVWVLPLCDTCGEVCVHGTSASCGNCNRIVHWGDVCSEVQPSGAVLCPSCCYTLSLEDKRTLSQLSHELDTQAAQAGNGY